MPQQFDQETLDRVSRRLESIRERGQLRDSPADQQEDVSRWLTTAAALARMAGAVGSGVVGFTPSPPTTAAAAGIGGLSEIAAQLLETPGPIAERVDWPRVGLEAGLSAVPLGKVYKGASALPDVLRGAGLAEVGVLGRRATAGQDLLPDSLEEFLLGDAIALGAGGAGGLMAFGKRNAPAINAKTQTSHSVRVDPRTGKRVITAQAPPQLVRGLPPGPGALGSAQEAFATKLDKSAKNIAQAHVKRLKREHDQFVKQAQEAKKIFEEPARIGQAARSRSAKRQTAETAELDARRAAEEIRGLMAGVTTQATPRSVSRSVSAKLPGGGRVSFREGVREVMPEEADIAKGAQSLIGDVATTSRSATFPTIVEAQDFQRATGGGQIRLTPQGQFRVLPPQGVPASGVSMALPLSGTRFRPVRAGQARGAEVAGLQTRDFATKIQAQGFQKKVGGRLNRLPDTPEGKPRWRVTAPSTRMPAQAPPKTPVTPPARVTPPAVQTGVRGAPGASVGASTAARGSVLDSPELREQAAKVASATKLKGVSDEDAFEQALQAFNKVDAEYGKLKDLVKAGEIPSTQLKAAGAAYGRSKAELTAIARRLGKLPEVAPRLAGVKTGEVATLGLTPSQLSRLKTLSPKEQHKVVNDLVETLKTSTKKGTEAGIGNIELMTGLAGAGVGAFMADENPVIGALVGGAVGFSTPHMVRAAMNVLRSDVPMSQVARAKAEKQVENAVKKQAGAFAEHTGMALDWYRASLLMSFPNLPINAWAGPWGAGVMASVTDAMAGDPRGFRAFKQLMNVPRWFQEYRRSLGEAEHIIQTGMERAEGLMGQFGPKTFQKITTKPAQWLTAGDIATRKMLQKAGYTELQARRVTLTSEPYTPIAQALKRIKTPAPGKERPSALVELAIPFYRTNMNQLEQGLERAPVLGLIWQQHVMPRFGRQADKVGVQVVQQLVSGSVSGAAFLIGTLVDRDDRLAVRSVHKLLNNLGGQYGTIMSVAFLAGIGAQQGENPLMAAYEAGVGRELPLPTGISLFDEIPKIAQGEIPLGILPGAINPKHEGSLPTLLHSALGEKTDTGPRRRTDSGPRRRVNTGPPRRRDIGPPRRAE